MMADALTDKEIVKLFLTENNIEYTPTIASAINVKTAKYILIQRDVKQALPVDHIGHLYMDVSIKYGVSTRTVERAINYVVSA